MNSYKTTKKDWLPSNHKELYDMAKQTVAYLTNPENRARMGFEVNTQQWQWLDENFIQPFNVFASAYEAWENPSTRTRLKMTALKDAQKVFTQNFRKLYVSFLKNSPLVTDTDLVAMNIPVHKSTLRTPVSIPATIPQAQIVLPSEGVVEFHYRDAGATNKAKPEGVHGVEIAWAILDSPPSTRAQLHETAFATRPPFRLSFDIDMQGKRLYYAMRWENTRGEKGDWSQIGHTVVS